MNDECLAEKSIFDSELACYFILKTFMPLNLVFVRSVSPETHIQRISRECVIQQFGFVYAPAHKNYILHTNYVCVRGFLIALRSHLVEWIIKFRLTIHNQCTAEYLLSCIASILYCISTSLAQMVCLVFSSYQLFSFFNNRQKFYDFKIPLSDSFAFDRHSTVRNQFIH